jgi:hypothetical protein
MDSGLVDFGGWVAPAMELVYESGTPQFRGQWPRIEAALELSTLRPGRGDWTAPYLELPTSPARPRRQDVWAPDPPAAGAGHDVAPGVLHDNPAGRVAALDAAGVALQLISPGPSIDACIDLPSNIASGVFGAYNQYIITYCERYPNRLGAVLQLHGTEARWSAQEITDLARHACVAAVSICLPVRVSPDQRNFDPLWAALEQAGLPVLHRQPLCAQVWTPQRLIAYLRLTGVLERFPDLRFALTSSAGTGPLDPAVLDAVLAPDTAGRVFAVLRDGQSPPPPDDAAAADALLWASDFPLGRPLREAVAGTREALGDPAFGRFAGNAGGYLNGRARP